MLSSTGGAGAEKSRDLDVESMTVGELKEKLKSLGFKVLLFAFYSVYCGSLKNQGVTLNVPKEAPENNISEMVSFSKISF